MEENLLSIKENIEKIRSDAAPFPGVQLMAVVKTRTPEEIRSDEKVIKAYLGG